MAELGRNVVPLGPWRCKQCGRELLLLSDTTPGPTARGYLNCVCGAEHYGGAEPLALFWRTKEGNWERIEQANVKEDLLAG